MAAPSITVCVCVCVCHDLCPKLFFLLFDVHGLGCILRKTLLVFPDFKLVMAAYAKLLQIITNMAATTQRSLKWPQFRVQHIKILVHCNHLST